jgi:hypothetical protein
MSPSESQSKHDFMGAVSGTMPIQFLRKRHKLLLWQRGGYTPTVQRQETANYAVLSDVER